MIATEQNNGKYKHNLFEQSTRDHRLDQPFTMSRTHTTAQDKLAEKQLQMLVASRKLQNEDGLADPSYISQQHSPASSLIFERDVQEGVSPSQVPAIPSHITTEDHIPPVLEASSAAIADDQLDPDSVEIVTHSMHQPAAAGVNNVAFSEHQPLSSLSTEEVDIPSSEFQESQSISEALNTSRVRRLSFVSFADVVNAEHVETSESFNNNSNSQAALNSGMHSPTAPRELSPSPLRSPASSHAFGSSPSTSVSASFKGLETSPVFGARRAGSPFHMPHSPHSPRFSTEFGGELNVETMQQALRKMGSSDLTGVRSQRSSILGTMSNDDVLESPL